MSALKPSYADVAEKFPLWQDYVDPAATMTKDEFDAMSFEEKVALQEEMFGPEEDSEELV